METNKGMCLNEIMQCAQNMLIVLNSMVDLIWGGGEPIWPLYEHETLHFEGEKDVHMSYVNIIVRQTTKCTPWICFHLELIVCFVSYKKWVPREK